MEFWGYGLLACAIAVLLSSVELITRYETRSLGEIFKTPYYLGFAVLNAFFCFVVYWSLPYINKVIISSQLATHLEGPLIRALVAGLGYLAIARSSLLDLKVRGETLGVGFDAVYNGIAHYLLRRHNLHLHRRMRDDWMPVYRSLDPTAAPIIFLATARSLASQRGDQSGNDKIKLLLSGKQPRGDVSYGLYEVIRNYSENADEAAKITRETGEELQRDDVRAAALKQELSWLYLPSM